MSMGERFLPEMETVRRLVGNEGKGKNSSGHGSFRIPEPVSGAVSRSMRSVCKELHRWSVPPSSSSAFKGHARFLQSQIERVEVLEGADGAEFGGGAVEMEGRESVHVEKQQLRASVEEFDHRPRRGRRLGVVLRRRWLHTVHRSTVESSGERHVPRSCPIHGLQSALYRPRTVEMELDEHSALRERRPGFGDERNATEGF